MKKKPLLFFSAIFLIAIISFLNTKIVVLSYRNQPEDFGIASAQGYGVMCIYILFPAICEGEGSQIRGRGYYLVGKEIYSYWVYLGKGNQILHEKQYFKPVFYCYNENKKRKVIKKDNYGIACSEKYKDIFIGYEL